MAENEEKPCHGNLWMSHLQSTYGSVSEAGEFGRNHVTNHSYTQLLQHYFYIFRVLYTTALLLASA